MQMIPFVKLTRYKQAWRLEENDSKVVQLTPDNSNL